MASIMFYKLNILSVYNRRSAIYVAIHGTNIEHKYLRLHRALKNRELILFFNLFYLLKKEQHL